MNIISVKSIFPFCKLKIGSLIPAIQIYMSKIGPRQKKMSLFSRAEEIFDGLGWTSVHIVTCWWFVTVHSLIIGNHD